MYLFRLQYSVLWCLKPTRHTGTRYAWKGVDPDTVEWSRRSDFSNKNCHHKWPISSFMSPAERVENFRPKNMPSASCFEMVRQATRRKASSLCLLGMLSVSKGSIWWSVSPAKMFGCEHDMRYTIYNMIGIWISHHLGGFLRLQSPNGSRKDDVLKSIPQSMAVYHCNAVLSGGVQSHTDVTDVWPCRFRMKDLDVWSCLEEFLESVWLWHPFTSSVCFELGAAGQEKQKNRSADLCGQDFLHRNA